MSFLDVLSLMAGAASLLGVASSIAFVRMSLRMLVVLRPHPQFRVRATLARRDLRVGVGALFVTGMLFVLALVPYFPIEAVEIAILRRVIIIVVSGVAAATITRVVIDQRRAYREVKQQLSGRHDAG